MSRSLSELEARFIKRHGSAWNEHDGIGLHEADGIVFLCPKCFEANAGPIGTHSVICWFVGKVADDVQPGPGRWNPSGTGLDDLTFIPPGRVSVQLTGGGCAAHFLVVNGATKPT